MIQPSSDPPHGQSPSGTDLETGTVTRDLLLQILQPIVALARRNARTIAALHVRLPDVLGPHTARDVGAAIRSVVRDCDVVARVAPDAFVVALLEVWEAEAAVRVARRLMQAVGEVLGGLGPPPSVGVAFYPPDAEDGSTLLRAAERATPGGGGLAFSDPEVGRMALRRAGLRDELAEGQTAPQFQLHYQPIRSLDGGGVVGAEALLRWNRSSGLLPAGHFIDLAESSGRIRAIDRWSMEQAFRQARDWRGLGWDGWIAVNLSSRSLDDPGLADDVAQLLDVTGAPADGIMFEVTERSALANDSVAARGLDRLREMGIRVAVDDFGTGYASFEYLCHFDPDIVKLDRAFTVNRPDPDSDLLAVLVGVAHRLGKPVVVEGVEEPDEMQRVEASHCEYVQGYLTGRPVSSGAFEQQHVARA